MLTDKPILIVEDNVFLAIDLTDAVEELQGIVIGPTNQVAQALELVNSLALAAAIIDCHLPEQDIAPLTGRLTERGVPFVLHCEREVEEAFELAHPQVPVLRKPVQPAMVLSFLMHEIDRFDGRITSSKLGDPAKMV